MHLILKLCKDTNKSGWRHTHLNGPGGHTRAWGTDKITLIKSESLDLTLSAPQYKLGNVLAATYTAGFNALIMNETSVHETQHLNSIVGLTQVVAGLRVAAQGYLCDRSIC